MIFILSVTYSDRKRYRIANVRTKVISKGKYDDGYFQFFNRNHESDSKKRVGLRRKISRSFSRSLSLKEDEEPPKPVPQDSKLIDDELAESGNVRNIKTQQIFVLITCHE